ncbi:FprA family A-type flavoprotein [bacterium]|nr:FprA family A-type flavoprotein [candidate division CSSED10-310 bacterium]
MSPLYEAVPVAESVFWTGVIDWAIRDFHGYLTSRGTSYNAFVVKAGKVTLVDTVKRPFLDEFLARVRSVVNIQDITYIVSNHAEMDHSGCLGELIELAKPEKVFTSRLGRKALVEHFPHLDGILTAVGDGEQLDLDGLHLQFMETRMLHWPDSMFSYLPERNLLFSQDGFGMHLAGYERFDDEIKPSVLYREAAKYYANILYPFAPMVIKLLARVEEMGLAPDIIAPDHGPIWRADRSSILEWYERWAAQEPTNKAVVCFDTMWGSTEAMARAVGEGLNSGGCHAKLLPLSVQHRSDIATELLEAGALLVGSPTMNNNLFPTLADTLTYLRGLKPQRKIGNAFGSAGWSGEAVGQLLAYLEDLKVRLVGEPVRATYRPTSADLAACVDLGRAVAADLATAERQ